MGRGFGQLPPPSDAGEGASMERANPCTLLRGLRRIRCASGGGDDETTKPPSWGRIQARRSRLQIVHATPVRSRPRPTPALDENREESGLPELGIPGRHRLDSSRPHGWTEPTRPASRRSSFARQRSPSAEANRRTVLPSKKAQRKVPNRIQARHSILHTCSCFPAIAAELNREGAKLSAGAGVD